MLFGKKRVELEAEEKERQQKKEVQEKRNENGDIYQQINGYPAIKQGIYKLWMEQKRGNEEIVKQLQVIAELLRQILQQQQQLQQQQRQ